MTEEKSSIRKNVEIIIGQNPDISENLLIINYWLRFDNATPHLPTMKMEHLTNADTILRAKRAYKGKKIPWDLVGSIEKDKHANNHINVCNCP